MSWLLAAGFASLVLLLAVLQWRWSAEIGWYELGRQQFTARNSGWLVRSALDHELDGLASGFRETAWTGFPAPAMATIHDRWRGQARWPDLLEEVYRVDGTGPGGTPNWQRLEDGAWRPTAAPLDSPPDLAAVGPGDVLWEGPSLVIPSTVGRDVLEASDERNRAETGFADESALVLVLDGEVLAGSVISDLVGRFFDQRNFGSVSFALRDNHTGKLFFSSDGADAETPGGSGWGSPAASVELLRRGGSASGLRDAYSARGGVPEGPEERWLRDFFAATVVPAGHWTLLVEAPRRPLPGGVAGVRKWEIVTAFAALVLLGATFLAVLAGLRQTRRLADQRLESIARVSHELRTPLAVISTAADNLCDQLVDDPERGVLYGEVLRRESARLTELIDNTLRLARDPAGLRPEEKVIVDLRQVTAEIVRSLRPRIDQLGFRLELDLPGSAVEVLGDPLAVRSAVFNLVSNALKYGVADRWIAVRLEQEASRVRLAVSNGGPIIGSDELTGIFRPYVRGRRARDEQIEGSGLGLAVVRDVMKSHGGDVSIRSGEDFGTIATLLFPKVATAGQAPG